MKKLIALCLALSCFISLAACSASDTGNSEPQSEVSNSTVTTESSTTASSATTASTTTTTTTAPTSTGSTAATSTTAASTTATTTSTTTTTTSTTTTTTTTTTAPAPVDKDAALKAQLIAKFGIPFALQRGQGFAFWNITIGETTVKREYTYVTAEGETQDGMSWKIENGELVISGDWNETFTLDIAGGKAISKKDGGAYNIKKVN